MTKMTKMTKPIIYEQLLTEGDEYDSQGICISCHYEQYGVEPDAEKYTCESCGLKTVYGIEQAVLLGLVEIGEL